MGKLLRSLGAGADSRLFVHCATSVDYVAELSASSPGVERYAERALLLAEPRDIVCVTHEVDASYLEFLAEFGLGPKPGNLVVASRYPNTGGPLWERLLQSDEALDLLSRRMQAEGITQLHPFMCTAGQFELARALGDRLGTSVGVLGGNPDVVAYADEKHHIRSLSLELGVPVAPGEVVDAVSLLPAVRRQLFRTGRVIVRGASGASGSATFICGSGSHDQDRLQDWLSRRVENRIFLVEALVDAVASPNIQIHVSTDGSTECVGITDQLLDPALTHW